MERRLLAEEGKVGDEVDVWYDMGVDPDSLRDGQRH